MEMLLTGEQAAERLQVKPITVRRQLANGVLRGIKRGRLWRVPESAIGESSPPVPAQNKKEIDTPETRAAAILAAFDSGDGMRRNTAIIELFHSDESTREIVFEAVAKAVEEYDGPEDEFFD